MASKSKHGDAAKKEVEKWKLLELKNERDIDKALARLDQAYSRAAGSKLI